MPSDEKVTEDVDGWQRTDDGYSIMSLLVSFKCQVSYITGKNNVFIVFKLSLSLKQESCNESYSIGNPQFTVTVPLKVYLSDVVCFESDTSNKPNLQLKRWLDKQYGISFSTVSECMLQ